MEILEKALAILKKYPLCDNCLGRLFALLAKGVDNAKRGFSIKLALAMEADKLKKRGEDGWQTTLEALALNGCFKPALRELGLSQDYCKKCFICENIFSKLDALAEKALESLRDYEFNTFLVGVSAPAEMVEREDILRSEFAIEYAESLKSEINREVGKIIAEKTGKNVNFEKPDVLIHIDLNTNTVSIKPMPLYIKGRYRKLVRGIPQAKWICSSCRGKGCERCNYTGKMYETSVEELISEPILRAAQGVSAKFHGAGREDVDARVLGSGRPFAVEVKEPKKRFLDLKELEKQINQQANGKVEVLDLSFADKKYVRKIKETARLAKKTYRAVVEVEEGVSSEKLYELEKVFKDRTIQQYTPTRVLHRRPDKLRVKKVYSVNIKQLGNKCFEAIVTCQGGLYVKELITGDNGRTKPSFSEILGHGAKCVELDVLDVCEGG